MIDLIEIELAFQIMQAAIIVAGAFVIVFIFNKLLLKMAGGKTSEAKRIIRNAQRFFR